MMCRYIYLYKYIHQFFKHPHKKANACIYTDVHRLLPPNCCYICNTWSPADSLLIFLTAPLATIIQSIPSIWKLSSGWCYTTTLISAFNAKSSHTFNCLFHHSHPRQWKWLYTQWKSMLCFLPVVETGYSWLARIPGSFQHSRKQQMESQAQDQ